MQQVQTQASRSLFTPAYGLDTKYHHHPQQQQQYHQPNLSVNTLAVDLNNDVVGKSGIRGMAIKSKVANAEAKARVKAGCSEHSHF